MFIIASPPFCYKSKFSHKIYIFFWSRRLGIILSSCFFLTIPTTGSPRDPLEGALLIPSCELGAAGDEVPPAEEKGGVRGEATWLPRGAGGGGETRWRRVRLSLRAPLPPEAQEAQAESEF